MALPENDKDASKKNEISVKRHEVASDKGNADSTFFAKMFEGIEKNARKEKTVSENKKALVDYLSRQDTGIDQRRIIRKIADNTDTIIDLLKDLKVQGNDKKSMDWKSMLPGLLPLAAGLIAAASPEKAKPYQTIAKATPVLIKGAGKAAQAAANAAEAAKAAKLAKEAQLGAEIVQDTSKVAGALGSAAKTLGKVGSAVSNSPIINKAIRYTGIGMTAGRALEGDYIGATAEAGSLALHEASRKAKSPKAKALLTAASLGTDAGIMVRDYFNGQEEKDKSKFAKEHGFVAPEKESATTKLLGMVGLENDQAKRIKEQEAALTKENRNDLAAYEQSQDSGFEKVKNIAGDALPFAAMAAAPLIGKLFKKGGLASNVAETAIGGSQDPIVDSGQKFADIVIDAANAFKSGSDAPVNNGRGRGRGGRRNRTSGRANPSSVIDGEFRDVTPSNRPRISVESGPSNARIARAGSSLGAVSSLKSKLLPAALSGIGASGAKGIAKGAAKLGAKAIPGLGLALGAYGAISRASEGDYVGALGEAVSGLASTVPIVGTAASIAIQGGLMYRDSVAENNESTTELNSITKDSIGALDASAKTNAEQLNGNSSLIDATNKTIVKNASDSTSLISKTGSTLASFTSNLGTNITDWLLKGGNIFGLAFAAMNGIKTAIGAVLSKIGLDKLNPFKNDTPNNGQIDYKLDTGKGEFDLGKHGGTMTSSIFKGESGGSYGIYNVSNGKGGWNKGSVNNSNTTLDQIVSAQSSGKMNAFGAYQIIGSTMKEAKSSMKLSGNEKMTPELQDKIYQDYLIKKKRKAIFNYITGKDNNINTAVLAGAMEWASIGVPHDMKGAKGMVKKGQSYYDGVAGNKAHITPEEFGLGLQQQKSRYFALKKKGMSDDDAYHQSFKKQSGAVTPTEAAGEFVGAVSNAADTVKSWFSKDEKKNSGNVVTKGGNVIPATLARPQGSAQTNTPVKQNASTIVKNAEKAVGINKANAGAVATGAALASTKTEDKAGASKVDWDLDILCKTAVSNAQKGSTKDCALYVRRALEKAQTRKIFSGGLGHAKDYIKSLPRLGWVQVGKNSTDIKKGDIAVFPKSSTSHDYGHVCIFTGKYWVSDFVQRQVQPNANGNWEYYVFRAKSGYTNGAPESAAPTDIEKAAGSSAGAGAAASIGGSESSADSTGTDENKSLIDKAIDAAVAGVAPLAAAFGNSETARAALDWVNSAKVDEHKQKNVDKAELNGFKFDKSNQGPASFKYKFGNGGGYNEDELFNPNLERQKASPTDLLADAGKIPGIVRQRESNKNHLADAGYIAGVVRQEDHGSQIGSSTFKKKKLKWYEKLFGSSRTGLFSDLAESLGFGDAFNLGKEIFSADKNGNLKDYGINKVLDIMSKDDDLSGIATIGKEIHSADKNGNLKDYAIDKALKGLTMTDDGRLMVKQIDDGSGKKLNKYVDQTTGEVSFGPDDTSDNDAIAKLIKEKGALSINPVSSALGSINPELGAAPKALMNLLLDGKEDDKGALNVLFNGIYGASEQIKANPRSSKSGWGGLVNNTVTGVSDLLFGKTDANSPITGFNPNESLSLYGSNSPLFPNVTEKEKVNGYVSSINREYLDMKERNTKNASSDNVTQSSVAPSGSSGKKSNLDGMSSSIVTRNPDSIFRAVSMDIMKTSTT